MVWEQAGKGIGTGIGLIGLGIGLKFLSDTSKDIRRKPPMKHKAPEFKPFKYDPLKNKKIWKQKYL